MNYKRIYSQIIKNRLANPLPESEYGQKHHILPKSLYPQYAKTKSNLVRLSAREHYICHLLLWKYYKSIDNKNAMYKMANAVRFMCSSSENIVKSRLYEISKKEFAKFNCGENHPSFGKKHSESSIQKMKDKLKGHTPWNKGITGYSLNRTKGISDESRKKMSEAKKGHTPWNKGKKNCQVAWNKGIKSKFRWINNGCKQMYIEVNSELPEGFIFGRIKKQ